MSDTFLVRCEPEQAESVFHLIQAHKDQMTTNVHTLTFADFNENIFSLSQYYYWCDQEKVRAVLWMGMFDPASRSAEFGVIATQGGNGDGRQATVALFNIAFGTLGLHRLYCTVNADNERCLKAVATLGILHPEGVMRQSRFMNGQFIDQVRFSILATDQR